VLVTSEHDRVFHKGIEALIEGRGLDNLIKAI
jgi:hypothetical protein